MLTADKTKDAADISQVVFAYNDIGRITDFDQTHFGGTERTIGYEYDQAGLLEKTTYPNSVEIGRSNHWRGSIDTLTRDPDGTPETLVTYEYLGARVAQRSYSTPSVEVATHDEACPERSRRDALGRRILNCSGFYR